MSDTLKRPTDAELVTLLLAGQRAAEVAARYITKDTTLASPAEPFFDFLRVGAQCRAAADALEAAASEPFAAKTDAALNAFRLSEAGNVGNPAVGFIAMQAALRAAGVEG